MADTQRTRNENETDATKTMEELLSETIRTRNVRTDGESMAFSTVAERLRVKFGLGDRPELRTELYMSLQELCQEHGMPVYRIIQAAARSTASATKPGHYFCAAVMRRLRQAGFVVDPPSPF